MHPRTRHINHEYHRFREWVKPGLLANPFGLGPLSETSESNHGLIVATVIYSTRECGISQSIWIWYCVEDNDELYSVRCLSDNLWGTPCLSNVEHTPAYYLTYASDSSDSSGLLSYSNLLASGPSVSRTRLPQSAHVRTDRAECAIYCIQFDEPVPVVSQSVPVIRP